jgi:lipid II isoglutaminyl synthase (glutamine-hydrolysing)
MDARLAVETVVARAVGRLSRAAGRGGGTTLPGKLLWKMDPSAVDSLASRLSSGVALVSATNGKTTTTAMAAHVLRQEHRLVWNHSGANLLSGIASALVTSSGAELGLFEVDEGALPEAIARTSPRAVVLSNLFRDQLDRYGELELVAERWRAAVTRLPRETSLVVNADDPLVADIGEGREGALRFGLDDPRHARPLQHAADSKYCLRCGAPYRYEAAYVGHLGAYRCPACGHGRPELDVAAREIELVGLHASRFRLATPQGDLLLELSLPGLYNVYNATAAASLALALGVAPERIRTGLESFRAAFGRFERIPSPAGKHLVMLLIKNPAGANEALRTLETGVPPVLVLALNDAIADGRDVSWIWDVDFEPLLPHVERLVVTGERAAELGLRLLHGGLPEDRLEVEPSLERALDRGLELTEAGTELVILPTYTAMLALRRILEQRGLVRPYWEAQTP